VRVQRRNNKRNKAKSSAPTEDDLKAIYVRMVSKFKTEMCKEGNCKDKKCFNAHTEQELRRPLVDANGEAAYSREMCPHVMSDKECPDGKLCKFSHNNHETMYHPRTYKTKPCRLRNRCERGSYCAFMHDEDILTPKLRYELFFKGEEDEDPDINLHHHVSTKIAEANEAALAAQNAEIVKNFPPPSDFAASPTSLLPAGFEDPSAAGLPAGFSVDAPTDQLAYLSVTDDSWSSLAPQSSTALLSSKSSASHASVDASNTFLDHASNAAKHNDGKSLGLNANDVPTNKLRYGDVVAGVSAREGSNIMRFHGYDINSDISDQDQDDFDDHHDSDAELDMDVIRNTTSLLASPVQKPIDQTALLQRQQAKVDNSSSRNGITLESLHSATPEPKLDMTSPIIQGPLTSSSSSSHLSGLPVSASMPNIGSHSSELGALSLSASGMNGQTSSINSSLGGAFPGLMSGPKSSSSVTLSSSNSASLYSDLNVMKMDMFSSEIPRDSSQEHVSHEGSHSEGLTSRDEVDLSRLHQSTTKVLQMLTSQNLDESMAQSLLDVLASSRMGPQVIDSEGNSALSHAVTKGMIDLIPSLANMRILNAKNLAGQTPLNIALKKDDSEAVEALAHAGASLNEGSGALHKAMQYNAMKCAFFLACSPMLNHNLVDERGNTALAAAAERGFEGLCRLLAKPNLINVRNANGETPLVLAAKGGHVGVFFALLSAKPDFNIADNQGRTPLLIAILDTPPFADVLLQMASTKIDISATDANGVTVLEAARSKGLNEIVRKLESMQTTAESSSSSQQSQESQQTQQSQRARQRPAQSLEIPPGFSTSAFSPILGSTTSAGSQQGPPGFVTTPLGQSLLSPMNSHEQFNSQFTPLSQSQQHHQDSQASSPLGFGSSLMSNSVYSLSSESKF